MAIPAPSDGQLFGHYRLVEQIGAGGMGVVFRAYDERLRRDVALKILPAGLFADEAARRQFRNEALAVGKLNHPNIAMAFDFGHENGVDYLVTEYVAGINLDEKISQHPLTEKQVLDLGTQLARGLDAAHRGGVIHRDLKPGNLRLTPDGHLKILDFGLARQTVPLDDNEDTINIPTEPVMSGTLPYMAPEVLRGELADSRSDIWAAGAVLYEIATGKRAFPDRQQTLLIDAILHYDPVRPSLLNPKVSTALEAVIMKALDREPEHRYQSARELRVDLARLAAAENTTDSIRRTAVVEVAENARRRKLLLILAGVLVVGIVIGGYWFTHRPPPPPPVTAQKILAVLPFDTVGQDPPTAALGAGLAETLTAKLVQASDRDAIQVVTPRDLRDQGVKTAEDARREFGTDLVLESSLQRQGNAIRINCSLVDSKTHRQIAARTITADGADTFGLQDRVVSEVVDLLPTRINSAERRKLYVRQDTQPAAYEAYVRGRGYLQEYEKPENIDSAITEFTEALRIDPNYAPAYAAMGNAYWTGYQQFAKGPEWVGDATRYCQKALSIDNQSAEGHVCLGNVLNGSGKYSEAATEFQKAVQLDPRNENGLRGLADAYTSLRDFSAAESTYKKVIALRPKYWGVYSWLGIFYYGQARYAEAAEMLLRAAQLAPDNYHVYYTLGGAYVTEGRYQDAINAFKRSLELRPSVDAYNNLGYTYILMHQFPQAISVLEQGIKVNDQEWENWGNLGDALYWSASRRAESTAKYQRAISIMLAKLEVNPKDGQLLAYLANYSAMVGDRTPAFSYLQRAVDTASSDGEVLLRAAIVYHHFGQTAQALALMKKAVDAGYSRTIIRDTPDFQDLSNDAQFRALVG
jgi:tetratricopeptide (TPR) repeat protein